MEYISHNDKCGCVILVFAVECPCLVVQYIFQTECTTKKDPKRLIIRYTVQKGSQYLSEDQVNVKRTYEL